MRIATFNVNGIRAAQRRGFGDWLARTDPDVVALQEVRCPPEQVPTEAFEGYHFSYDAGSLAGRNGVAVLTRTEPEAVRTGFGSREFDHEGRYIEVDLPRLTVASVYIPKGGTPYEDEASLAKHERKLRFLDKFSRELTKSRRAAARAGREFVVMGDFNVAHTERDLKNWKTNKKSEGFLPVERDWFGSIVSPRTLTDVVRDLHPGTEGPYSWWSWRGQAFTNDAGWRIDYHLASRGLAERAVRGGTMRDDTYDARISDHAPVVVDYDFTHLPATGDPDE
ncbi:exodeoxyribonuclease III [Granulicoccus phenolivorans]|uniref:exodeoxyribonuclease III n=1 Tax=Granulicoccus phenolivorans TaxID=266854 RepID=UPI0004185A86|nr:exodeoxyribonuclease III [Granulicoccus phenolivorans]